MKFFKKYSNWIIAFIFVCAVIAVYKTFDNIPEIFGGIGHFFGVIFSAFAPFFGAFVIAYVLNIPAAKFRTLLKKVNNKFVRAHYYGLSVALSVVTVFAFVAVLIVTILPIIYSNIVEIIANLPGYIRSIEQHINGLEMFDKIDAFGTGGIDIFAKLTEMVSNIDMSQISKYLQSVLHVTSSIFSIFIAVIAAIYMLLDKERLVNLCKRLLNLIFKPKRANIIIRHASSINNIFINYIYSRLICGIITAALCGIVLAIIGVKYAVLLAIIIALMDLIPYFGSIISCVISIAVALLAGGIWKAIWTTVALVVIQQIDGNVLGPKIMGDNLETRPLWVIFAVTVGGSLFGFWGMLISVPILAAAKAVLTDCLNLAEGSNITDKMKETFTAKKKGASTENKDEDRSAENDGKETDDKNEGDVE